MNSGSGKPVLVIGGGIAGLTAAVELADTGCEVILVEKSASLGGRVARMHQYFPKLCPPACGLEMHFRRLRDNAAITVLTLAEVTNVSGSPGDYGVDVRVRPRCVTDACTLCGECAKACPVERADDFNYGLTKTRAAYLPHGMTYPARYADRPDCLPGQLQGLRGSLPVRCDPSSRPARSAEIQRLRHHRGHGLEAVRRLAAG